MRTLRAAMLSGLGCLPTFADAADPARQEAIQELGSVLAWRMGPETVEEACRPLDPEGVAARKQSLDAWLAKNAPLIGEVDTRVAAVAPALYAKPTSTDVVKAIRAQIRSLLLEVNFDGLSEEDRKAKCRAEADPASPRWNNPGMPQVKISLAVLYDWQVRSGESADP